MTVPNSLVAKYLDAQLEKNPETCPICTGKIDTTVSLQHDRECLDCGTKFMIDHNDDHGRPIPSVEMRTTPIERIKRNLEQYANECAVIEELAGEE